MYLKGGHVGLVLNLAQHLVADLVLLDGTVHGRVVVVAGGPHHSALAHVRGQLGRTVALTALTNTHNNHACTHRMEWNHNGTSLDARQEQFKEPTIRMLFRTERRIDDHSTVSPTYIALKKLFKNWTFSTLSTILATNIRQKLFKIGHFQPFQPF